MCHIFNNGLMSPTLYYL